MAAINNLIGKQALVSRLLAAKEATGKTFTQISREVGLTNVYTAQLFYNQVSPLHFKRHSVNASLDCFKLRSTCSIRAISKVSLAILQAQLKPDRVEVFKKAVPQVKDEDIAVMKRVPFRSYDESITQEPLVYRLKEVWAAFQILAS